MKKQILFILLFFLAPFVIFACIPNLFKNNDSVPSGYDKINFSPANNPSELIRDSLDKSLPTIQSANNIFSNKGPLLSSQIQSFINSSYIINTILNENDFASYISDIPTYTDPTILKNKINALNSNSFIFTLDPINSFNQSFEPDSFIFTKIIGKPKTSTNLYDLKIINNTTNEIIKDKNIKSRLFTINTYYARNLFPSWNFPLNNSKNTKFTWEILLQCTKSEITLEGDNNKYEVSVWPRIAIIQLNSNSTLTDRYILIKNNLIFDENQKIIYSRSNLFQRTQRNYNLNSNGLAPQSYILNWLTTLDNMSTNTSGESYIFFQDGMSSFFSRFLGSILTPKNMIHTFASWQTSVNKDWFEINRNRDASGNLPDFLGNLPIKYLNKDNNEVENTYSKDFQLGGIHYVNPKDTKPMLLEIPNSLNDNNLGLSEKDLTNICQNIVK